MRIRILIPALALAAALPAFPQAIAFATDAAILPAVAGTAAPILPIPAALRAQRILGIMPDYLSVRDTTHPIAPLTSKQKWQLVEKQTVDPFNIATAFMTAACSQRGNQTPKYGEGDAALGKRFGAAMADFGTQNFFSAGVLANLLHQDPRYFRKGPDSKILTRVAYSLSRLVIARQDSGRAAFNASNLGGMALGIVASNAYYPAESVRGSVMAGRISTSLMGGAVGNLMSEFWPDLEKKFFHRHGTQ